MRLAAGAGGVGELDREPAAKQFGRVVDDLAAAMKAELDE